MASQRPTPPRTCSDPGVQMASTGLSCLNSTPPSTSSAVLTTSPPADPPLPLPCLASGYQPSFSVHNPVPEPPSLISQRSLSSIGPLKSSILDTQSAPSPCLGRVRQPITYALRVNSVVFTERLWLAAPAIIVATASLPRLATSVDNQLGFARPARRTASPLSPSPISNGLTA
jgi:hypothetical protein